MGAKKYENLIVTGAKADLELPEWRDVGPRAALGPSTRVVWLDDDVIKGAFYVECVWYWPGAWKAEPLVEAHTHPFDEVITFFGTNPHDPQDLGGEVELWLEDEQYVFTESCLVFVPKGLRHCPLIIRRVDRPIFHFTAGPGAKYA